MSSGAQVPASASGKTKTLIAAAAIVVLATAGVFLLRRTNKAATEAGGVKRVAALPFENLGDAEDGYFADGMTDEVRSKLAGLSGLSVIASTSSGQYKATTKPSEQIGKELGVGYLLLAKVRWQKVDSSSRIRVSPELVELAPGLARSSNALAFYHFAVRKDEARARELLAHALKAAPDDGELLVGSSQYEESPEKVVELLRRAGILDPRSAEIQFRVAANLVRLRRGGEARVACDRGLAISPANLTLQLIQSKVMTYLQEGDLAGARAVIAAAPGGEAHCPGRPIRVRIRP